MFQLFDLFGFASPFMTREQIGAVFGSARWADSKEIETLSKGDGGLLIGRDPATSTLLRYDGPAHLLTMAPTRTGKGVGTIIPNLLTAQRAPLARRMTVSGFSGIYAKCSLRDLPLDHIFSVDRDILSQCGQSLPRCTIRSFQMRAASLNQGNIQTRKLTMASARRVALASRPTGQPTQDNFRIEEFDLPEATEGEVTVRSLYLSLDPYMRGRMSDVKSYAAPVAVGGVMEGEAISQVIRSRHTGFAPGDIVRGRTGWSSHAVVDGEALKKVETHGAPITTAIGVLGMPGFTAWSGLKFIGQPKKGETVVVAAASGPVGSMVGQLAKLTGARAVGIAGGPEKCAFVKDELGFDAVIDHRSKEFASDLSTACPEGVDVYFENVGGHVWDGVLPLLNQFARIPVCGLVAHYNGAGSAATDRLPMTMSTILRRSLLVRGFIQTEFVSHFDEFLNEVGPRLTAGEIKYREDIVDGLENAPEAFIGMLTGGNFGKLVVKIAD